MPDGLKKEFGKIQLNLPKDLLNHLLYLANLKDPIFQSKVENLIKNREDLQKYLLATKDLNKTIEESLKLAVGHGKINESAVKQL